MDSQNACQAKRWLTAAGLLYLCFVVYGSLVPLQFRSISMELALKRFGAITYFDLGIASRSDWVANILLFIPLAFFWAGALWPKRSKALRGITGVFVFAAGAMLAVGIEFTQLFFPQRTVSLNDIAAETIGAALGVALWVANGQRFLAWVVSVAAAQGQASVASRLLIAYLLVLYGYAVMPLDLTLSPVGLYHKWNEGRVILLPLGVGYPDFAHWAYAVSSDLAIWVPAAMLWRMSKPLSNRAVVYRVVLSAALIEFSQLFVYSRVTNLTDVFTAALGAGIGLGLAHRLNVRAAQSQPATQAEKTLHGPHKDASLWCCATLVWLGVLAAVFWYPFDFNTDASFVRERFNQASQRVLFEALYFGSEYRAYSVVLHKVGFMLPLGLLLGKVGGYLPASVPRSAVFAFVCLLLGWVACGIEVGQLALPGKVGDVTDVLIEFAGGVLGYVVYRFATSRMALPRAIVVQPPTAGTLPPQAPAAAASPLRDAQCLVVGALALLFWLGSRVSGLPYNVAKLMPFGAGGALSSLGLALAIWWMLAAPMLLLRPQHQLWRRGFPLLALTHALVSFAALRATVPLAMLHKIIGNPVLGWGGPWEDIGRYVALHLAVMLPLYGASLLVRTVQHTAAVADLIFWFFVGLLLFWPLHWVVVACAGTDNLVELMRDGGSLATSAAIGTAVFLLGVAGSALGAVVAPGRRLVLLVMAASALAAAPWLFSAGLEPMLVKYGRAFSALQFIVSSSRDSYAVGTELNLRALLALLVPVLAVAALQARQWRALAKGDVERLKRIGTTCQA